MNFWLLPSSSIVPCTVGVSFIFVAVTGIVWLPFVVCLWLSFSSSTFLFAFISFFFLGICRAFISHLSSYWCNNIDCYWIENGFITFSECHRDIKSKRIILYSQTSLHRSEFGFLSATRNRMWYLTLRAQEQCSLNKIHTWSECKNVQYSHSWGVLLYNRNRPTTNNLVLWSVTEHSIRIIHCQVNSVVNLM